MTDFPGLEKRETRATRHVWSIEEILMMADSYTPAPKPRGPYKKRVA